jgi:hypothetical protein
VQIIGACSIGFVIFMTLIIMYGDTTIKLLTTERIRNMTLEHLPIHRAILDGAEGIEVADIISKHAETAKFRDIDGRTAFELAVAAEDTDLLVISVLLMLTLPYDPITKEETPEGEHGYAWTEAVQHERFAEVVEDILSKFPNLSLELATARDAEGRQAMHIASPRCRSIILQNLYFFRRYEITTTDNPHYESDTCIVHLAVDHDDDERHVALKFMRNRDEYKREIDIRSLSRFEDDYVIGILRVHDGEESQGFREEVRKKGFDKYPRCIVMEAGERNLFDIISKENFAGADWDEIRLMTSQIVKALDHMHSKEAMHGDLKRKLKNEPII